MKRIDLYLTEVQLKQLKQIKEETGISSSESVRRALDIYLSNLRREINGDYIKKNS